MSQRDLFQPDTEKAAQLRNEGMRVASLNAESISPKWGEQAYLELKEFVRWNPGMQFMAEDVRAWAGNVAPPPSKRAWGAVILRAAKAGLIERVGYKETSNPLAHRTPATLWRAK